MKKSRLKYLVEALDALPVEGVLSKKSFIEAHWGTYDFWTARSFDVFVNKAKKVLPIKTFCGKFNKEIKRLS